MKVSGEYCVRKILDEYIAVPVGDTLENRRGIASMNDVGAYLFEKLSTDQTVESLVEAVTQEYDVDETAAEKDILAFLERMRQAGILEE